MRPRSPTPQPTTSGPGRSPSRSRPAARPSGPGLRDVRPCPVCGAAVAVRVCCPMRLLGRGSWPRRPRLQGRRVGRRRVTRWCRNPAGPRSARPPARTGNGPRPSPLPCRPGATDDAASSRRLRQGVVCPPAVEVAASRPVGPALRSRRRAGRSVLRFRCSATCLRGDRAAAPDRGSVRTRVGTRRNRPAGCVHGFRCLKRRERRVSAWTGRPIARQDACAHLTVAGFSWPTTRRFPEPPERGTASPTSTRPGQRVMRPCRTAIRTASVRLAAPSFPQIDATWDLTVWSLMSRRAAIALFGSPSARSCSILGGTPLSTSAHTGLCIPSYPRRAVLRPARGVSDRWATPSTGYCAGRGVPLFPQRSLGRRCAVHPLRGARSRVDSPAVGARTGRAAPCPARATASPVGGSGVRSVAFVRVFPVRPARYRPGRSGQQRKSLPGTLRSYCRRRARTPYACRRPYLTGQPRGELHK